ncbi:hypothetical protein HZR00_11950 [Elizabethkingia anophelis]|nr:hypothetical protein [Elizabethkingia anophelis]
MIDNLKLRVDDQDIIHRLFRNKKFVPCKPKTNSYHSFKHINYGLKMSFDFRKAIEKNILLGYSYLEINISPHYHNNQYLHNGNDFTPLQAIKTISDIFSYLGIKSYECNTLKVCNIEFGINIIPEIDIKDLIDGLFFYKKTFFKVPDLKIPYFKKLGSTGFKQIKAYAKGLQFIESPKYNINPNTFRFEIKSKQSKYIKTCGINTVSDLIRLEVYHNLFQKILAEWDLILAVNLNIKANELDTYKSDDVQFIQNCKTLDFWNVLKTKHRNTFHQNKSKYYELLKGKENIHLQIKKLIIDKLNLFSECADSTQPASMNTEKQQTDDIHTQLINLESAHSRKCIITGCDISMQKKNSKFLFITGLKYIRDNEPEMYRTLQRKFLTEKGKRQTENEQMKRICKNIRNRDGNERNNRKAYEKRNYKPGQSQLPFEIDID